MATNYTMGQAARAFYDHKIEVMADIMKRFPYASMLLAEMNEAGVLALEALPEYDTVRKLDKLRRKSLGILKGSDDDEGSAEDAAEDEDETPKKVEKKAAKKSVKKAEKKAETAAQASAPAAK